MKIRFKDYILDVDKIVYARMVESYDTYLHKTSYVVDIRFDEMTSTMPIKCDSREEAEELLEKILGD